MVTPNERVVLEMVAEEGGETTIWKPSSRTAILSYVLDCTFKSFLGRGCVELSHPRKVPIARNRLAWSETHPMYDHHTSVGAMRETDALY